MKKETSSTSFKKKSIFFSYPSLKIKRKRKFRPNLFLFLFPFFSLHIRHTFFLRFLFFSLLFHTFFEPQKKPLLFSSLLSLWHTKKKKMDQYPNKETEKLFEGVENGDEEVVKALLLGNKNKQFELDINFQFKHRVFFFKLNFSLSLPLFSLSLSLLLFWCDGVWMVVLCWYLFCFCSFFLKQLLFVKGWKDRSSHSCWERFWTNCENSYWTWFQCSASRYSFDFLFFYLLLWVHCWFVSCWVWMVVLCDIWFCFCYFFLTTFFLLKDGKTALHRATEKGFEQIVKILVEHGPNVDFLDPVLIFSFLFVVVGSLLGCFVLIVNGCVVWYLILFLFFFLKQLSFC